MRLKSSPKLNGFTRSVLPQETLERVKPLLSTVGVTRVSDITGLDRLGIPVWSAVVPRSRDLLSVYNGKGFTHIGAKVGAIMEAFERHAALTLERPVLLASYREISRKRRTLDPRSAGIVMSPSYSEDTELLWLEGHEISTGEPTMVPLELAGLSPPGLEASQRAYAVFTSNGLASGNTGDSYRRSWSRVMGGRSWSGRITRSETLEPTPKLKRDDREVDRLLEVGARVVDRALAGAGSLDAECIVRSGTLLTAKVRMQQPKSIESVSSQSLGLRLVRDGHTAMVSTNELTDEGIVRIVRVAKEMLDLSDQDSLNAPVDGWLLCDPQALPDLDLIDPSIASIDPAEAVSRAAAVEAAALVLGRGVSGSDGATFKCGRSATACVFSRGFRAGYSSSSVSSEMVAIVPDAAGRSQRGPYSSRARHLLDLEADDVVGTRAAKKALAKVGAKTVPSCRVPVIFDRDAARGIVRSMSRCVLGSAAWRRTSYLAERTGSQVASELVNLVDDGLVARGGGSRPFDGEGIASVRTDVVTGGTLRSFLCDSYSARKLGRTSTASALRGTSGGLSASTSNFLLLPGSETLEGMIRATRRGLLVTDLVGYGFNAVTGHFSPGAVGFWIEGAEVAHPVNEITIAGDFDGLWKGVDSIGSSAALQYEFDSPPFRVAELTLGGR